MREKHSEDHRKRAREKEREVKESQIILSIYLFCRVCLRLLMCNKPNGWTI